MTNEPEDVIGVANVGTLLDEVRFSADRWKSEGVKPEVVERLRELLDQPGGKAGVVCRFIGWENASMGTGFEAILLKTGHRANEIGEAFDEISNILWHFGRPGGELGKALRSRNKSDF